MKLSVRKAARLVEYFVTETTQFPQEVSPTIPTFKS